ncbi:hypothetical protein ANN_18368 [Periplaneta americana]|uniref:Reverse transcriptase domain-containing protein n=1 Tax=Periplaneta americana TaxID=6978 RepID=A0ABQ8SQN6_PERAM|nr:hypothetical protein ANN_18368 [Periplaneta americana]
MDGLGYSVLGKRSCICLSLALGRRGPVLSQPHAKITINPGGTIINRTAQYMAYADDIVILSRNVSTMDEILKQIEAEAIKAGLEINNTLGQTDGDIRSSLPQNMRRNSAFQMSKRSDEECDSGDDGDDDDNVFYENSTISESKSGGNLKYTKFTSPLKTKKNVAVCKNLTTNILNKENKYECKKELKEGDIIENCDKHTSNNGPPLLNKKQASKKLKKRINASVSDNLQFKKRTETNRRKGPKSNKQYNKSEFEVTDEERSDIFSYEKSKHSSLLCKSDTHENFSDENNYSSRNERKSYKYLHKSLSFKEEKNALDNGNAIISESTTKNRGTKKLQQNVTTINRSVSQGRKSFRPKIKNHSNKSEFEVTDEGSSDSSSIFLNRNFIDENNYSSRNERNNYKHLHKSLSFKEEENALDDGSDIISESTTTNRKTKRLSLKLKKNKGSSDSSSIFLNKNFIDENNYSSRNERNSYKHLHKSLSFEEEENALDDGSDIISESTTTNRGTKSLSLKLKKNVNKSVSQSRKSFEPKIKNHSNKSEFEVTGLLAMSQSGASSWFRPPAAFWLVEAMANQKLVPGPDCLPCAGGRSMLIAVSMLYSAAVLHYCRLIGESSAKEQEGTKGMAYIPCYGPISGKISRLLRKHEIKTIHKPPTKIQNLLRPVKDDLGLRTPGVYKIPCECGKCYIGQMGCTIMERCKEHQRSMTILP